MASKIEISNVFFVKFYNDLKIDVQALIDPLNRPVIFSLIRQVVFKQQTFKVLKSVKSIAKFNNTTLSYIETTHVHPLSSPMVDFNIEYYGDKSKDRAICSH